MRMTAILVHDAPEAEPHWADALVTDDPDVYFTTPHFNGYPAILVHLDRIALSDLEELLVEAWLVQAPKRLAAEYLSASGRE